MSYSQQLASEQAEFSTFVLKSFWSQFREAFRWHRESQDTAPKFAPLEISSIKQEEAIEPGEAIPEELIELPGEPSNNDIVSDSHSSENTLSEEEEYWESMPEPRRQSEPQNQLPPDEAQKQEDWEPTSDGGSDGTHSSDTVSEPENDLSPDEPQEQEWIEPSGFISSSPTHVKTVGFFQENRGKNRDKVCPFRVGSFLALISAILLGGWAIAGNGTSAEIEATYALLASAFGMKTVRKFQA